MKLRGQVKKKRGFEYPQWFKETRLFGILNAIVPNRYIGTIYALFLIFAALNVLRTTVAPSDGGLNNTTEEDFESFDRYTGVTESDTVVISQTDSRSQPSIRIFTGHRYKILVVYRAYRKSTRYLLQENVTGKYTHSSSIIPLVHNTEGPAIICIGRNAYGFINAPKIEHTGFLHLVRVEKNKINKTDVFDRSSDTSLYSTDCQPPDAAVIRQLNTAF